MREFALADSDDGIHTAFAEVLELSRSCGFADCRHNTEPNCAVRESMDAARYASYQKLEKEAAFEVLAPASLVEPPCNFCKLSHFCGVKELK